MRLYKHSAGWLRANLLRQFVSLVVVAGVLMLGLNYVFVSRYFDESLMGSMEAVERDYMQMQGDNLEILLRSYRTRAYELALDSDIYALARRYEQEPPTRAALNRQMQELLSNRLQTQDCVYIALVLPDRELVYSSRLRTETVGLGWFSVGFSNENEALDALCERAQQAGNVQVGLVPSQYLRTANGPFLMHIACPLFRPYTIEPYGTVVVSFNTRTLNDMTNPQQGNELHSHASMGILTDGNNVIIAHPDSAQIGKKLDTSAEMAGDGSVAVKKGDILLERPVGLMGMKLYRVIDREQLMKEPNRYRLEVTVVLSLVVVLMLLLVMLVVRRMMRSVRALQQGLGAVHDGALDVRVRTDDPNEIGQIIGAFNEMTLRLKQGDEQRRAKEREAIEALNSQRVAEIKALENQINSHFLYNTINSINFTALAGGNLMVSRQLKHLSQMLRYTFERSDGVVTAEQESQWLGEYLALQKLRFGDAFDYVIKLDEGLKDWPMRKLLLQPFVENSVLHGLNGRTGGLLLVRFQPHGKHRMRVTIEDNGSGMDKQRLSELLRMAGGQHPLPDDIGIGLENALLRIRSYYGGAARVVIRSWQGQGTKVVVLLPRYDAHEK